MKITICAGIFAEWYMYIYPGQHVGYSLNKPPVPASNLLYIFAVISNVLVFIPPDTVMVFKIIQMHSFFKNFWKTIIWAGLIVVLSCLPEDNIPSRKWWDIFPHQDKILHLIFYCILSLFFIRAYQVHYNRPFVNRGILWISFVFIFLFGMILEIIQEMFIQSRAGELLDLVFDLIGLVLAFIILYLAKYFKNYLKEIKD